MADINWKEVGMKALTGGLIALSASVAVISDFNKAAIIGLGVAVLRGALSAVLTALTPVSTAVGKKAKPNWKTSLNKAI